MAVGDLASRSEVGVAKVGVRQAGEVVPGKVARVGVAGFEGALQRGEVALAAVVAMVAALVPAPAALADGVAVVAAFLPPCQPINPLEFPAELLVGSEEDRWVEAAGC